jgi:hypothetical protein
MSLMTRAGIAMGLIPDPIHVGIADAIWNEREGIVADKRDLSAIGEYDRASVLMRGRTVVLPSGRRISMMPKVVPGFTEFTAYSSTGIPAVITQNHNGVVARAWATAFAQAVARDLKPDHPICFMTMPSSKGMIQLPRILADAIDAASPIRVNEIESSFSKEKVSCVTLPGGIEVVNGELRAKSEDGKHSFMIATTLIRHPRMGDLRINDLSDRVGAAMKRAPLRAIADTFPVVGSVALPSAPTGNARAAGILRLCAEALAIDPDMTDPDGGRIAPLVHEHLPRLLKRHAQASIGAPASELRTIDADLEQGLETVRAGVERALASSRSARRDALATELGFLRARHPSDDAIRLLGPV